MITLLEHIEMTEKLKLFEGEAAQFTPDQLDLAEYYALKWNPVSGNTLVCLYDAQGQGLGNMEFNDPDLAIAFVEEFFDLDDDDIADLESYSWASDTYDDRLLNAQSDDGTSDAATS